MCSRYFLDADGNVIAYAFHVPPTDKVKRRFNIAPTQEAPVVREARGGGRELAMLRWGLVPYWAKDLKVGTKMINARSETVAEKPAFRAAFEKRRCIVPASGFFEWQGEAGRKQPFAITLPGEKLFAFAGLWERWKPEDGEPVESFTIVTTDANTHVAQIHDRMPVILPMDAVETWLTGPTEAAAALMKPWALETNLRKVGRFVSNVNNEGPQCLDDAEPPTWDEPRQGSLL